LEKQFEQLCLEGRFADAAKPAEALLALREGKQGKSHWETADVRLWLELAKQMAKEPDAVQRALVGSWRQESEADRLQVQAKFKEAEPIRAQVLTQTRKILGEAHPETGLRLQKLGAVQVHLGKLKEAEESLGKALEIDLKTLPPGHPSSATSYNNLG